MEGAARFLGRGKFPELASSHEALQEWAQGADPVLGWLDERVTAVAHTVVGGRPARVRSREAYDNFKEWALSGGYSQNALLSVNTFSQRVAAAGASRGITYKHSGTFRGFLGMRLKSPLQAAAKEEVDAA